MKKNRTFIICFLLPCVCTLMLLYLYPVTRTVLMSFFKTGSVTASVSTWSFAGIENYKRIFSSPDFMRSIMNMLAIWIVGGAIALSLSLLFAVCLTQKIRFSGFFKSIIFIPNIISTVALGNAWVFYVYNNDFGLLNSILKFFNLDPVKWMGPDLKLFAMMFAIIFSCVGYYMLFFIGGIESIPKDIMEAAEIDGASRTQRFWHITLPLLSGTIKSVLTFWTIAAVLTLTWTKVFSPITAESSTIVPMSYMYEILFGSLQTENIDIGTGAAAGIIIALIIQIVQTFLNRVFKPSDLEV